MSELTNKQIANLTVLIMRWIIHDPALLRSVAREQAEEWALEEYYEQFPEEKTDE